MNCLEAILLISEQDFSIELTKVLKEYKLEDVGSVTGPGRSGAIASVYASHLLRIPFIPYGSKIPTHLGRLLIIDTATESGATLRKAKRRYEYANPIVIAVYNEPPRVHFWYEACNPKPQFFKHERKVNYEVS
jgi:hypothetical protein